MTSFTAWPARAALAFALALSWAPVHAKGVTHDPAAPMEVHIAAQPLAEALNEWARQTRISIAVSQAAAAGKSAPAVSGNLTPREALDRLLRGSGLAARFEGHSVAVEATLASNRPETKLDPVNVTALASRRAVTEGTGSYTVPQMNTATRLDLSMRETPQAVTVITRQRIEDQGLSTVNEVVQTTPGLTYRQFGPSRASFYSRGMYVDNIMYDGLPVSLDSSNLSQDLLATDMSVYDRVEIVRGATGLVQGAGNPAAAINLVRKRPTASPQVYLTGSIGNWDRRRLELDAGGSLSKDRTLRGRMVAAYEDNGSFKDGESSKRKLLYGILEKDLGVNTTLALSGLRQEDNLDGNGFTGLPVAANGADLGLPRHTSFANPWEYWNKATTSFFASLDHHFDSGWRIRMNAYHSTADFDMLGHYIGENVVSGLYTQYVARNKHREKQDSYDLYASGPFDLFGRNHELIVGASSRKVDFDGRSHQGAILTTGTDLDTWAAGSIAKPDVFLRDWMNSDIRQKSAYVTTRLDLADPLKVILGARMDWYDYRDAVRTYPNYAATVPSVLARNTYSVDRKLTRYAGVIYDIGERHSAYVSYTDIFKPQNYLNANNKLLSPIQGKNYEVGIKGEYFGGALNASVSVFRLDQADRAYKLTDQTACEGYPSTTCYAAAGLVRSQGYELELQGALTPQWQLAAGYTFTNARYRKDANPANVGKLFDTDTPRHLFKLSTSYQFTGDWQKWRVGSSLYWQNLIFNGGVSSGVAYRVQQKAYLLVDAVVGFQATRKLDLRLNVDNLFDRTYYTAITGSITFPSNVYGEPRNVMLTGTYRF